MPKDIRTNLDSRISDLIYMQVPMFIRDQHPAFVDFMKAYYEFMESKLDKEIISPSDGVSMIFTGSLLTGDVGTITIPNLTLAQLISISSEIQEGNYLYTSAKFKENRGPISVVRKDVVSLGGYITSILDDGNSFPKIRMVGHGLGQPGAQVNVWIYDTVSYDGKYEASVIDQDHITLNTVFRINNFGGTWGSNSITITTDTNIVNESCVPLALGVDGFYLGQVITLNCNQPFHSNFEDGEIIWQPMTPSSPDPSLTTYSGVVIDKGLPSEFQISKAYILGYTNLIGTLTIGDYISAGFSSAKILNFNASNITIALINGSINDFSSGASVAHSGGSFDSTGTSIVSPGFNVDFQEIGRTVVQYSGSEIIARGVITNISSGVIMVKEIDGVFLNDVQITELQLSTDDPLATRPVRYLSDQYKNILVRNTFGSVNPSVRLYGLTSEADYLVESSDEYKVDGLNTVIVKSESHPLDQIDSVRIIDSPDYTGTYTSTKINSDYFSIPSTFNGNNEGASFIDAASNQRIKIYSVYDQAQKGIVTVTTVNSIGESTEHGLSKDDVVEIIGSSVGYNGKHTIRDILSPSDFTIYSETLSVTPEFSYLTVPLKYGPSLRKNNSYIGTIYHSKKNLTNADIDRTIQDYLRHFNYNFLPSIPEAILADRRLLLKHIKDLYKSKGTEKSWKLLFRLLFENERCEFYYPSVDILKMDNGLWLEEKSLLVNQISNPVEFGKDTGFDPIREYTGKRVIGSISLATGLVNEVRKIWNGAEYIYEVKFEKNSITGVFRPNEDITTSFGSELNRCRVLPIFQDINITNPGEGYQINEFITITTPYPEITLSAIINSVGPLGEVLGTKILNRSLGYPVWPTSPATNPTVVFSPKTNTATGEAIIGALIEYEGRYIDEDGPDTERKFRDDYYYQEYSYVVNTLGVSMSLFEGIAKKLVHPAGMKMFCNVLLESRLKAVQTTPATPNPRWLSVMSPYGGSIFGKPLYCEVDGLTNSVNFPKNIAGVNELVGQTVTIFQKPLPPTEFLSFNIISNNSSGIVVDDIIPSGSYVLMYGVPQPDTDGAMKMVTTIGTGIGNQLFVNESTVWMNTVNSLYGYPAYIFPHVVYPSITTTVDSNTRNTITVNSTVPSGVDTIRLENGSEYNIEIAGTNSVKILNVLWSDGALVGKNIYANIYDSSVGNGGVFMLITGNTEDSITVDGELVSGYDTVELFKVEQIPYSGDKDKYTLLFGQANSQNRIKAIDNLLRPEKFITGSTRLQYSVKADYIVKPYYSTREIHLVAGATSRSLRKYLMRTFTHNSHWVYNNPLSAYNPDGLPNPVDPFKYDDPMDYPQSVAESMKQPVSAVYSGSATSPTTFSSSTTLPSDYLIGRIVYSYNSSDRNNGRQSIIEYVAGSDIDVIGDLFPGCDSIEIEQIPTYWRDKAHMTVLSFIGTGLASDFTIVGSTDPYQIEQFVGKQIQCYNSSNKHVRHISTVTGYSGQTLSLSGDVPIGCDSIDIVYEGRENYWLNHTNYPLDYFTRMINMNNRRVYILPEPRHYQF